MNNYVHVTLISSDHFFPFLLKASQSPWVGRALRECYLGERKILLKSQAYSSNGHISVYAYPFSCQIVLFIAQTTQNSHERQYSELLNLYFCIYIVSHPHKPLSLIPCTSIALFYFKHFNSREGKLGIVLLPIKKRLSLLFSKNLFFHIHVNYSKTY